MTKGVAMIRPLPRSIMLLLVTIALAAVVTAARAEPYRPVDPHLVLLRVTPTAGREVERAGSSLQEALALAELRIAEGRRAAQPRGFGRAEAILATWRTRAAGSADWHVLAADIHQYRHEYPQALALLENALRLDPRLVRARLMRAAIRQTAGDFSTARQDCTSILAHGEQLLGTVCLAQILGLTGQVDRAYGLLERQLQAVSSSTPAVRVWMLTALADMAERRGDVAAAERHLRAARLVDSRDLYAGLALGDLLLAHERAAEVEPVLDPLPKVPGTLLRRAESRHARGIDVANLIGELQRSFADAASRGEQADWRDVARLNLLTGRGCEAMQAARRNWAAQREPVDVRLLALAAAECRDASTLEEVRRWLTQTRYEDAQLTRMLRRPEATT